MTQTKASEELHSPPVEHRSLADKFINSSLSATNSAHLDLVRAFAAWAVMWGHLRGLFFVDYHDVSHPNAFIGMLYFMTGFGHQAVVVFFILSGFLISSSVFKMYVTQKWSLVEYAINRAARLYVVLIPGLVLGLLWDGSGMHWFGGSGLYTQPLDGFGSFIVKNNLTTGNFFGNLAFLQTIKCATFGSNGPLWSLANEFWYYVLFPLTFFSILAYRKASIGKAIFLTLVAIAISYFVGMGIFFGYFIWLMGTALVLINAVSKSEERGVYFFYIPLSFVFLSVCLYAARLGKFGWLASDFAVGLAFAFFLFGVIRSRWKIQSGRYARTAHTLAAFSYSLYVLHFPLVLFLRAWLVPGQKWQPDTEHLVYGLLLGSFVLIFAWSISLFTEYKTATARKGLRALARGAGF